MSKNKITLLAENCWLLRSTMTWADGSIKQCYYVTPSCWNTNPTGATIFPTFEDAEVHMNIAHKNRAPLGWADGRTEIFDVVLLSGAIMSTLGVTVKRK